MRRHLGREPSAVTHTLDDSGNERGAVELRHLPRDRHVLVDQWLVVDDHILVGGVRVSRLLEAVGLAGEEVLPDVLLYEVEERDDVAGADLGARGFAIEEEVEELETDGVTLNIEAGVGIGESVIELGGKQTEIGNRGKGAVPLL